MLRIFGHGLRRSYIRRQTIPLPSYSCLKLLICYLSKFLSRLACLDNNRYGSSHDFELPILLNYIYRYLPIQIWTRLPARVSINIFCPPWTSTFGIKYFAQVSIFNTNRPCNSHSQVSYRRVDHFVLYRYGKKAACQEARREGNTM